MSHADHKPILFVRRGGEKTLPGAALVELIQMVLARGADFRFRATGRSMWPIIRDGDVVVVSRLPEKSPRLGDVVVFFRRSTGNLVLHRVIERKASTLRITGDNLPDWEDQIPFTELIGYVSQVSRNRMAVRFGISRGCALVALLSRTGLWRPLSHQLSRWFSHFAKRRLS